MPDHDSKTPQGELPSTEDYPNPADSATSTSPSLREKILQHLHIKGTLPFPDYLDMVLYDADLGYYARSSRQVGRAGDFYTSVSVGPLFGQLLARRFLKWWEKNDKPTPWRILEIGAHDGTLAADILTTLKELSEPAWAALEYAIPEPLPRLHSAQREKLAPIAAALNLTESTEQIAKKPLPGIAFGNEILDALPFHLIQRVSGNWQQLAVTAQTNGALSLIPQDIPENSPLAHSTVLQHDFKDGYQTEIRTNFRPFLESLASCLENGLLLFFDYGFAAPEYYDSQRSTGTLRTFSNHQAAEDPLERPGEIDITAHVDFTNLAHAAGEIDYSATEFATQGSHLTHLAKELILSGGMDDTKRIAQFQSLTHPAHLGGKFHAIEFQKGAEMPQNVRHRLAFEI